MMTTTPMDDDEATYPRRLIARALIPCAVKAAAAAPGVGRADALVELWASRDQESVVERHGAHGGL